VVELNEILTHLQATLGPLAGAPRELPGGITNRNLHLTLGDAQYVLRQPGKDTALLGIDRESECLASQAAAELGIAPAVASCLDECLLTAFHPSRPLDARAVAAGVEEIAHALRRFHDSPTQLPTRFSVPNLLADYATIVRQRGGALPAAYDEAQAATARIAAALPLGPGRPCHNDLLAANFIRAAGDGHLLIVDWEYAGMGDPRFDLGNLSVNNDFDDATDERLLCAYHGCPPADGERAALALMRVLSDAREGAWGVVQAHVSELDVDFHGYAAQHFERLNAAVARPEFEVWLTAAAEEQRRHARGQAA
jgi:aminoglycoside phosphotransferase (APT) family kinase protein